MRERKWIRYEDGLARLLKVQPCVERKMEGRTVSAVLEYRLEGGQMGVAWLKQNWFVRK